MAGERRRERAWFWGLLSLAALLRALNFDAFAMHHPDEVLQYIEPAYRLLTGDGIVTWEYRYGMRSWLLPWLLAGPMALGQAVGGTALSGGKGGVLGTLAGVLLFASLDASFNMFGVDAFLKQVLRGAIVIAAVAVYAVRNKGHVA